MIKSEKCCTAKFIKNTLNTPTGFMLKNLKEAPHNTIQIAPSKHSKGNKELVASVIEDFLIEYGKIFSSSYQDSHSSLLRDRLASEFPMYTWHKNSSQHPFDIYSVDAGIAIENKSHKVGKNSTGFGYKNNLVVNATLYPSEARVSDIVPKRCWKHHSAAALDSFMDVLIVIADKTKTNNLVRYKIVDGNYWGIDYDIFQACSEFFNQLNDPEIKNGLLDLIINKYDNKLACLLRNEALPGVKLDLRKLLTVKNPNTKE